MGITDHPVRVLSDANVIIHRMNGYASVSTFRDQPLHGQALELAQQIEISEWCWVPRQFNLQADTLSRLCFNDLRGDEEEMQKALDDIERRRQAEIDTFYFLDGMQIIQRADLPLREYHPSSPPACSGLSGTADRGFLEYPLP